mmetsp:Transcript_90313/g.250968  ORF Transcript_90313/g.250968 Transcript_90313/m.250968 type:complete len:263 (-) Transcript_90313:78-866(-)
MRSSQPPALSAAPPLRRRRAASASPAAARTCRAVGLLALAAGAAAGLGGQAFAEGSTRPKADDAMERRALLAVAVSGLGFGAARPAVAELMERRRIPTPPIDRNDKTRCQWRSSSMGQANAARDKLFDMRECKMAGTSAADKDIAGVFMTGGDFTNVDFTNTIMSKAIANNATFDGANFRNAVVDRTDFSGSSMKGVIFKNTVLTGSTFTEADLSDADFTDSYIEMFGIKPLCRNPTLKGTNPVTGADTYESAGCYNQGLAR